MGKITVVPAWALRLQAKLKKPKYNIGDIVFADVSNGAEAEYMTHFTSGVGVVIEVSYDNREYGVHFGPKIGEECWYPEDTLELIRKA